MHIDWQLLLLEAKYGTEECIHHSQWQEAQGEITGISVHSA